MQKKKNTLLMILTTFLLLLCMPTLASAAIRINQPATEMVVGQKMKLAITGTSAKVKWSSSNKAIAKVYKGNVTAKKKGTVTITAKVKKKSYTCTIKVKQPVTSMTLDKESYFLLPGNKVKLKATCLPTSANLKTVKWSSSNKAIAKVSKTGMVTGIKNGTVTITATAKDGSGVKAVCKIIVLQSSEPVTPPEPAPPKEDPIVIPPETSARGAKFLKILEGYDKTVTADAAAGKSWHYSNSKQSTTFKEAVSKNNRVCDCAKSVTWALLDLGILSGKERIYGDIVNGASIVNYGNNKTSPNYCEDKIKNACTVTQVNGTVQDLIAQGKIVPGDIITYKTIRHTNVYAGKTPDGKFMFYDSGHGYGDQGYDKNGYYYFNSFHTINSTAGSTAAWVIHIN